MIKVPFRASEEPVQPDEMSLLEHLVELRKRVIRSVLAILVAAIIVWVFANPIFLVLRRPYCQFQAEAGSPDCAFLVTAPMESFSFLLTIVGYGGLLLALPVVLYQFGRFVMPGLYPHERRILIPFAVASVILLAFGVVAAYFVTPQALRVLNEFGFEGFTPFFTPSEYIGFLIKMLVAFGIAAELPLVLIFLQMVGVVRPETLAGNRRIAIAAIVLLGAIITPTGDPFNLALVAVPMYLFFEFSIVVGRLMIRRRSNQVPSVGGPG